MKEQKMNEIPLLIIEDNASHSKLEKLALANSGYDIRAASNADEAMKILAEFHPRLILMDIQLPGMDGLELTQKLKADPRYSETTIIAITAYGMKGDRETALAAGCDGYLSKPIDVATFPQSIAEFLSKKK
jgi:CheY-like chemotaxis protein